jgi:hypothetical protein
VVAVPRRQVLEQHGAVGALGRRQPGREVKAAELAAVAAVRVAFGG